MHFAEYQLSQSLISLSLLFTGHHNTLQRIRVRSSKVASYFFNLPMNRSPCFGLYTIYFALFRLAFATHLNFLLMLANTYILASSWCKRYAAFFELSSRSCYRALNIQFQVLFHSAVRCSFHFSFAVLLHYRSLRRILDSQMVLRSSK